MKAADWKHNNLTNTQSDSPAGGLGGCEIPPPWQDAMECFRTGADSLLSDDCSGARKSLYEQIRKNFHISASTYGLAVISMEASHFLASSRRPYSPRLPTAARLQRPYRLIKSLWFYCNISPRANRRLASFSIKGIKRPLQQTPQPLQANRIALFSISGTHTLFYWPMQRNRPGKSSSVAGSIVLRDCATMKLSPQCRSGTAGHHHPSQTRSKHFLVLSTIETLEIPFKRCWIT